MSSSSIVAGGPVIVALDQSQRGEISWDAPVPRKMKSFEGALIRRADVLVWE
jgi:hypothetical protein